MHLTSGVISIKKAKNTRIIIINQIFPRELKRVFSLLFIGLKIILTSKLPGCTLHSLSSLSIL